MSKLLLALIVLGVKYYYGSLIWFFLYSITGCKYYITYLICRKYIPRITSILSGQKYINKSDLILNIV